MKDISILGSNGKLGSGLMKKFEFRAIGTTRNSKIPLNRIYFDLNNPSSFRKLCDLHEFRFALIVAAISEPDQCYTDQKTSYRINVDSTIEILKVLKQCQIKPIFISTEMVFDGTETFYSELHDPNPILIYGKQKLEVEKFILSYFDDFIILRLAKIYSSQISDKSMLYDFYEKIINNERAMYAIDQYFSPTLQSDFENAIFKLVEKNLSGLFNVSSGYRTSRWKFFELFANAIGRFGSAEPCLLKDIKFCEPRPKDLSLNGAKLSNAIDFEFTSPEMGIVRWIQDNKSLLSDIVRCYE